MNAQILLFFRIGENGQGRLAADIMDGKPDRFMGDLCFGQIMDFKQAAELFGGEFAYPEDLDKHGFQTDQSVAGRAEVWYRLSDGSFGMAVCFTKDWDGRYGAGKFGVESIVGYVEYLGKEAGQYLFVLKGKFVLGMYRASMALSLSSGKANFPTVLTLEFEKNQEDIALPDFIDSIAGTGDYEAIPIPDDYTKPEKAFGLNATLNLTEQIFLLEGSYRIRSTMEASLVIQFAARSSDLNGMDEDTKGKTEYTSPEPMGQEPEYIWWIGAQLKNFTLSDISSALKGADRFLGLENVTAAVILANAQQEIHITEERSFLGKVGTVHKGLTFQIEVRLCDSFLKEVLDIQGICRISGYIPQDKAQAIVLSGHGDKIVFLQFLSLTDIEIMLRKNAQEKTFLFSAGGDLKLDFPELPMPKIRAELSFEENQTGKKVMLLGKVGEPVENPLGIPNTRLEEVVFTVISESFLQENTVEKREQIYFRGQAEIAEIKIAAMIYFAGRKPAVVELAIGKEQRLSISSMVRKYFDFEWPEILDIQLYNGCLWYCLQDAVIGQRVYRSGFHAQLDTKIFFLPEFTLSVDIGQGTEFMTEVRLKKAAELAFLKFYTKQGEEEYGPQVTIQVAKGKTVFTVSTCVTILSVEIGEVKITVGKNRMEGTFRFPDNLPITGQVGFSVDEKGLSLEECGIGKLPKMDFNLPKMEVGKGKCKVRVLDEIKFKTVPEVTSKEFIMDDVKLGATFDLTIRIKSESSFSEESGDDFVTLPFEGLSLSADIGTYHKFTFDTFLRILGDNITDLVKKTAEQIITGQVFKDINTADGMKNIAKFLTIAGITWGINELVSYLICQGLKEALANAFVAALTGVQESLWEGAGYFLMLGGILGSQGSGGTYTVERKAPKENKEEQKKNPQTPDAPMVFFQDEKLIIRWEACKGAQGYSPVVSRRLSGQQENQKMVIGSCKETVWEITGSDEESLYLASYGFEYLIRIYAWNSDGAALGKETSIYLLRRPANMKIRYQCEKKRICLAWDQVEKAGQYEVERLWYEQGETRREIVTYESDVKEVVYENQEPNQTIEVSVRGKAANVSGPAVGSGRFYLYDLKPPGKIEGYNTDEGIILEWEPVPYADRYRVNCLDGAGRKIKVSMRDKTQAMIEVEKLKENVCYKIQIQPMTEEIEGWVSEEVQVLWRLLPVPEIQELVCGEDGLLTVVFAADHVRYKQIVYPDGRVVVLDEQPISCEWDIGKEAKVRLIDRARQGKWSEKISVLPVRPPEGIQVFIEENTLHVQWNETGEDCLYGIEIVAGDGSWGEEMLTGTSWQTDISLVPTEEIIRVCLYAIDRRDTRRRSVSMETSCYNR